MIVVQGIDALRLERPWVTWGVFDGVHLGHQALLRALGKPAAVITFDPHPEEVLFGREIRWLAPLDLRLRLLERHGVDAVAVQKFSREFSEQGPEEFFLRRILDPLRPAGVVLGHDSAFGRDRAGTFEQARAWGVELGVEVRACEAVEMEGVVSSSRIRDALARGDVADAARCLGRPYRLVGHVVAGRRRGRSVGFPTCNLEVHGQAIPAAGVYGGRAHVGGAAHACVINVGVRPTFEIDPVGPVVEAHLLDTELDAYGLKLELDVELRIREERKFAGAAELREQIRRDIETFRRAIRS